MWLCEVTGKPILKLTEKDYLNNNLSELLEKAGPFDKINIDVFNDLQHTITGWPGGKPNADDSTRPVKATPFPKTVLIFSPHPDDDVSSRPTRTTTSSPWAAPSSAWCPRATTCT